MTYIEYVKSKTTKELRGLNESIEVFDCFGVRDLILREAIEKELYERNALND